MSGRIPARRGLARGLSRAAGPIRFHRRRACASESGESRRLSARQGEEKGAAKFARGLVKPLIYIA